MTAELLLSFFSLYLVFYMLVCASEIEIDIVSTRLKIKEIFILRGSSLRRAIYTAFGDEKYLAETVRSAKSLRSTDRQIEIIAYIDEKHSGKIERGIFDRIECVDFSQRNHMKIDFLLKLKAIKNELTDYTLFLDSDTFVCHSLNEAWKLLERFDVLACHAAYRRRYRFENYNEPDFVSETPSAFCELNTGVLFIRKNEYTIALIDAWQKLYEKFPLSGDQYLFMDAIYNSECQLYVLPPEYNYRPYFPGFVCDQVRIVHARHPQPELLANKLNELARPRVSIWRNSQLEIYSTKSHAPKPSK